MTAVSSRSPSLAAIEKVLATTNNKPLSHEERAYWPREFAQYREQDLTLANCVAWVLERRLNAGRDSADARPRFEPSKADPWRWWLLSELARIEASADAVIQRFRAQYLPDGLLPYAGTAVSEWVAAQHAADTKAAEALDAAGPGPAADVALTLVFADPSDEAPRRVTCVPCGVLSTLAHLGGLLAERYVWPADAATAFVLTGATPVITGITEGFSFHDRPMADRIRLDVHPMCTTSDVADTYERVRAWYAEHHGPLPRPVPVREHSARLAVFIAEAFVAHAPAGMSRAEQWEALKQRCPELPQRWKATAEYRDLRTRHEAPTYARPSDWWRDARAALEHFLFLQPVKSPAKGARDHARTTPRREGHVADVSRTAVRHP